MAASCVLRVKYGLGHFSQKAVAVGGTMPLTGGSGGLVSVPQLLRVNYKNAVCAFRLILSCSKVRSIGEELRAREELKP